MAKVHPSTENALHGDTANITMSSTPTMVEIRVKLRQRWELASVLNFLHVFEPLVMSGLKVPAEELEAALIEPNNTLAQLHTSLLKGIVSHSISSKTPDVWIIHLSKTLAAWWPWVAEGDFPLAGAKGKEISTYQELGPTDRLVILKALCEARADQPDIKSYVNDALKDGTEVCTFRMDNLADDGKGNIYWYDGNEITGHRLYKEVRSYENKQPKHKASKQSLNCQWETVATDLDEFNKIVEELSLSSVETEVALSKSIEADIIPILTKQWKKKMKALRLKERVLMPSVAFRNPGVTRSCRNRRTINYRFDDYDKAITEAIKYTNKRKIGETTSNQSCYSEANLEDNKDTTTRIDQGGDVSASSSDEDYDGENENIVSEGEDTNPKVHRQENVPEIRRSKGLRFSSRIAGVAGHIPPESMNLEAKKRPRQKTAVEPELVVVDSEDEE